VQRSDPRCPSCTGKPCPGRKIGAGADRGAALILGAVLAGGRATRFGADKAEATLRGIPLIDHAAAALRPYVADIVLVGRASAGWTSLADRPQPGLGPHGGIAAARHPAREQGYGAVLTIGCDMPGVPPTLLDALIAGTPAYCADAPVLGCWPNDAAPALDAMLSAGAPDRGAKTPRFSMCRWAASLNARAIAAPSPLANVNTPADLAALE
jgi:molybdopterin-guanine dinucleotide biosynthesis protein A